MACSDIFRHIVAYRDTLSYSEFCHIHNFGIFTTQGIFKIVYKGTFRHIQTFNNDSYNNINFIVFTLILHFFQQNLKQHVFWLQ